MDKRQELKGLIKEVNEEMSASDKAALEAKWAAQDEANAKLVESNKELKAQLEGLQGKIITLKSRTGVTNNYLFKGFNPELSKNFKATLTGEEAEKVAEIILKQAVAKRSGEIDFTAVYSGTNAVPVQYGNAVMGLAELSSVALSYARVIVAETNVIKLPAKGTREAIDTQASGTANVEGTQTIGQITWTIDKRVGGFIELRNDQLEDANFDIVNQIIVPFQAEAIGQNADDEMFNGTEFTSSVADVTAIVDSTAADSITFANLVSMFYGIEWERLGAGADPKWFGPRAALATIAGLVDSYGRPIFQQVPINGRPSQTLMGAQYVITPAIAASPASGKLRLAFGEPSQYIIFIRGGQFVSMVNPYIKMKEDITQFICKARMDGNIADTATPANSTAWAVMKEV